MSGDAEQEYFADGMVEDIITELARLRWLFVIARNSSFTYKGRAVDVKQVGRELGVRYVLEGSVRRAGSRVRITGQLIDAADRRPSLGRPLRRRARRRLRPAGPGDRERRRHDRAPAGAGRDRARQAQADREPRRLRLLSCAAWRRSIASARPTMPRRWRCSPRPSSSIPTYAAAYGMAARCYLQRKGFGWVADRAAEIAETRRLARRAAELGRDDAVALANAGMALIVVAGELDDGAALLEQALALNQNLAWVWHFSALAKAFLGEPEAAIEHAARAMRLSPQDPQTFAMQMATAWGHFFLGRDEEASSLGRGRPAPAAQLPGRRLRRCRRGGPGRPDGRGRARPLARLRELDPALRLGNLDGLPALPPAAGLRPLGRGPAPGRPAGMSRGRTPGPRHPPRRPCGCRRRPRADPPGLCEMDPRGRA